MANHMPPASDAHPISTGCLDCNSTSKRYSRGLCLKCYGRHRHAGTIVDYERPSRPADELLAEWDELRRDGYSRREAAARIGVTREALAKAIQRANRKVAA